MEFTSMEGKAWRGVITTPSVNPSSLSKKLWEEQEAGGERKEEKPCQAGTHARGGGS